MAYANEKRIPLSISINTSGDNTILAAPTDGSWYAIDFIALNPDGGANTVTIKDGQTGSDPLFALNDNQPLTFENAIHDPEGVITVAPNTAFIINLSASTRVTGYMKYRKCGGNN